MDLSSSDLSLLSSACDVALELTESKKQILDYVGARMAFAAPNLTAIVGASIAAEMMGAAGGLGNLSKMPAGHVQLLGQKRRAAGGFSVRGRTANAASGAAAANVPHAGFIYYSDVVQQVPPVSFL